LRISFEKNYRRKASKSQVSPLAVKRSGMFMNLKFMICMGKHIIDTITPIKWKFW